MVNDRFGNPHAPDLPYGRGSVLATTEDDFRKLQRAWRLIRERGADNVFVFTGLEHGLPITGEELRFADDEIAPALSFARLRSLALEHFGGTADRHDVAVFNRMTGATLATHLSLVRPGDAVIGVSTSRSHPSVARAANHAGARFVDTTGRAMFEKAMACEDKVALVDVTRLAVTYDLLPLDEIRAIVRIGHDKGPSSISTTPAAPASDRPALASRGCSSSASISAPPASTNTAPSARVWGFSAGDPIWFPGSGPKASNSGSKPGRCSTRPWSGASNHTTRPGSAG
jgi:hypothetical protein